MIEIVMWRDSVGMADDIDAPHEQRFVLEDGANLFELAQTLTATSYLPMPNGDWKWTIEAQGAKVAVYEPRGEIRALRGDPSSAHIMDQAHMKAYYERPSTCSGAPEDEI